MSEVLDNIVIGDMENASSELFFRAWGITRILGCAVEHINHRYPSTAPSIIIGLEDDEYPAAESQLMVAAGQLEQWINQGHRVFVHCKAGISRSPAVVMAWLIRYKNYSFDDAWCTVVKARQIARPNPHFIKILKGLEEVYPKK